MKTMILDKGLNKELCAGLGSLEFQCKCLRDSCHFSIINEELIDKYEKLRVKIARPLDINSGFRCQAHNLDEKVKGRPKSRHTKGMAIDISTRQMSDEEKSKFIKLCNEIFPFVLVYETFVHVDVDKRV